MRRQTLPQSAGVGACPLLEQVEVFLADAAGEEVSPALEEELAGLIEAQSRIRPIELLFNDDISPLNVSKRDAFEVLIPQLEARAFEVLGARVFVNGNHARSTTARATMWLRT